MSKYRFCIIALIAALLLASTASGAIVKVAKRYNLLEVTSGLANPIGTYTGFTGFDFTVDTEVGEAEADYLYNNTFNIGISYGQLRSGHVLMSLGFRYTRVNYIDRDTFVLGEWGFFWDPDYEPSLNQYDLKFDANYYLLDISKNVFSPYAGIGALAGLTVATAKGYDSESWLNVAVKLNFGAEVNLTRLAGGGSFVTLASINSWELTATGDRPKYLNIGGGLKYYFRP